MALILRQNNAQRLHGLNAEAEAHGLRPGMTLPEAPAPCRRPTLPEPIGLVSDALLTRIGSLLGLDNIPRFRPADSHIPKRALRLTPAPMSNCASPPVSPFDHASHPEELVLRAAELGRHAIIDRNALAALCASGPRCTTFVTMRLNLACRSARPAKSWQRAR